MNNLPRLELTEYSNKNKNNDYIIFRNSVYGHKKQNNSITKKRIYKRKPSTKKRRYKKSKKGFFNIF